MQSNADSRGTRMQLEPFTATGRLQFAHALRGLAALSVVIYHFLFVFFRLHTDIAQSFLGVSPLVFTTPIWAIDITLVGQFGVGIFFIISGFVIPFSMTATSRLQFAVKRAFRIYPTYIVSVTIVAFAVVLLDWTVDGAPPFGLRALLAHYLILGRGLFTYRIDGISWTLEIELVFYIVVGVIGLRSLGGSATRLIVTASLVAICAIILSKSFVGLQCWSALLLVQGLAYYRWHTGGLSQRAFLLVSAWTIFLMATVWWRGVYNLGLQWLAGYLLAQVVFALAYRYRDRIKPSPMLDHLGEISYPLYCVHALTGYAVIYISMLHGVLPEVAVAAACLAVYVSAVIIHVVVEAPSIELSRRLAARMSGR